MDPEVEYLSGYRLENYERPSVAADIVVLTIRTSKPESFRKEPESKLSLLLVRRGVHPYKDHWALPGGFLRNGETVEQCALRETQEETSVTPAALMNVGVFSEPGRDPRGWIISNAFVSIVGSTEIGQRKKSDASDARWFDVSFEQDEKGEYRLTLTSEDECLNASLRKEKSRFGMTSFVIRDSGSLAFDHAAIIALALTALRGRVREFELVFDFLPEKFTLTELQTVQETVMNVSVVPANFRRKAAGLVEETDEYTEGAGHRPARLFRKKDRQ